MAEYNCEKKEELAQPDKAQKSKSKLGLAYIVGAVVLGLFRYYIYQRGSPGDNNVVKVTPVRSVEVQAQNRANKFEIE